MALLGSGEMFKRYSQARGLWGYSLQEEDCNDNGLPLSLPKSWLWSRQFCSVILSWYGARSQNRLQSNKVRQSWVVTSEMWVKKKKDFFSIYKLRISVFLWWWKTKPLFQLLKFSQQFFPCLVCGIMTATLLPFLHPFLSCDVVIIFTRRSTGL